MEMHKSSFEVPSKDYQKQITNGNYSLKVEAGIIDIVDALKSFIDYDKVAIITRHSIRGEDYSISGPLTDLGKEAAKRVGARLKKDLGEKNVAFYSTPYVRCIDTATLLNKGWNNADTVAVDTSHEEIGNDYFGVTGGWTEIVNNVRNDIMKEKVLQWKSQFLNQMPEGISWWVSHDQFLIPIIYNLTDEFNPEKYKQLYKFDNLPWVSPLTGIIIAIKNDDIQIKVVSCLETGFISSEDYNHNFFDDVYNSEELHKKNLVATTFTHPRVNNTYKSKPDLSYIFDKSNTNSNPLYCDNSYAGCGSCVSCQNCDGGCQTSCETCDGCNTCQTCYSCQALCQNSGYSWTLYKEKITECSSCVDCRDCVGGYRKYYVTKCNPCNSCNAHEQIASWSECNGCQWGCTSCTSCNGCNDNSVAACVTGFYSIGINWICSPCIACHASCTSCNHCNGCDSCNGSYGSYGFGYICSYKYSCSSSCVTCDGCTSSCHGCTGRCYGCNGCTSCTGCQNCTGCQAACTGACQGGCYAGCVSCNSKTTVTGYKCDGCTNEQPILRCVPECETGCYKGCTADNSKRYKRYKCTDLCMTCVGIDDYACPRCYNTNYDVEYA